MSEDGGRTFSNSAAASTIPTTTRCGSIPRDTDHLILGTDGGVYITENRGNEWRSWSTRCR